MAKRKPTYQALHAAAVILLLFSGCTLQESAVPGSYDSGKLDDPLRARDTDLGEPAPTIFAPPLAQSLVFVQSLEDSDRRAAVSILEGGIDPRVGEICIRNLTNRTDYGCFPTHGPTFRTTLHSADAGDIVAFWTNGAGFAPGGPEVNGIETRVLVWSAWFPTYVRAVKRTARGLFLAAFDGLYLIEDPDSADDPPSGRPPIRFTIANGLASNNVFALAEDPAGNLWVGTWAGLNRLTFDERTPRFTTFKHDPGNPETSLASDYVLSLAAGRNGEVWVGTVEGLSRLTFEGNIPRFRNYVSDPDHPENGLPGDVILGIAVAPNSGDVWVGTYAGLSHLRRRDGRDTFTTYLPGGENRRWSVAGVFIATLAFDPAGRLWIGTESGLSVATLDANGDPAFVTFTSADGLRANWVTAIRSGLDGKVWLGTYGGGVSLAGLEGEDAVFSIRNFLDAEPSPDSIVNSIELATDGIWVGTNAGLKRMFFADGTPRTVKFREGGLAGNEIRAMVFDRAGTLWVGTERGLSRVRFVNGSPLFKTILLPFPSYRLDVLALEFAPDGTLWVGGLGGVAFLNPADEEPTASELGPAYGWEAPMYVSALKFDALGRLWIGTDDRDTESDFAPLSVVDFETQTIDTFGESDLSDRVVLSLETSAEGMRVGTSRAGVALALFSGRRIDFGSLPGDSPSRRIRVLAEDAIGGEFGLSYAGQESDGVDFVTFDSRNGFAADPITAIARDGARNILWVGAYNPATRQGGLSQFRLVEGEAKVYTYVETETGFKLPSREITALALSRNALFVGTGNGLVVIPGEDLLSPNP